MTSFLSTLLLGISLGASPQASSPRPAGQVRSQYRPFGHPAARCPTFARPVPPATCRNLPSGYGVTPRQPLRWGWTGTMALYQKRFLCPRGGWFRARRLGSRANHVDVWQIDCPSGRSRWYVHAWTCGNPCLPRGFEVIPVAAFAAIQRANRDLRAGRHRQAVAAAREALRLAPPGERLLSLLGVALHFAKKFRQSLAIWDHLVAAFPRSPYHRLHRAIVHRALGVEGAYRATIERLLDRVPAGHRLAPELLCRQAYALRRTGKAKAGRVLAGRACRRGFRRCCRYPD